MMSVCAIVLRLDMKAIDQVAFHEDVRVQKERENGGITWKMCAYMSCIGFSEFFFSLEFLMLEL